DRERAAAWLDSTFPVNAARAEKALEEAHRPEARGGRRLAIARTEDDEVVGGVQVSSGDSWRRCGLAFSMAPWRQGAGALRAEPLRLLVHWLRDETEVMVVTVDLAADETETIATAEALDMARSARLREWYGRPGSRVDCLRYQALNPRWEVRDA